MEQGILEGMLCQDRDKRYCLCESDIPAYNILTCTSGCPLEIWCDHTWIAGRVEGDGEDYWLFSTTGEKFLLTERMKARYHES